jgi:Uma2 family endonuclease
MALAYEEYYTIDDYKKWEGDWELISGMPYAMSPFALPKHQLISGNIFFELKQKLNNCKCEVLMECEIIISTDTILRPDVIIYCDKIKDKLTKTPSVVFEVVSKTSIKRDEIIKKEIYEQEGVKYFILVYPDKKRAKAYENKDGKFFKIADEDDIVVFNFECEIEFDFKKIWKRHV